MVQWACVYNLTNYLQSKKDFVLQTRLLTMMKLVILVVVLYHYGNSQNINLYSCSLLWVGWSRS